MLGKVIKIKITILFFLGFSGNLLGQDLGNSPYSQVGIGDILNPAFSHQAGMSNVGVSQSLPFIINNINPALNAQIRRTILDVGATGQFKEISQGDVTQTDFGGSLSHIGLAFPVTRRISTVVGISPYSSVNYENNFRQRVTNVDDLGLNEGDYFADVLFRGSGGLTTVFLSTGWELLNKKSFRPDTMRSRLFAGLKINYIFGSITDESISDLIADANETPLEVAFFQRTTFSDFVFEPGLAYSLRFGKDNRLNFGATYAIGTDLSAKRFISIDRRINDQSIDSDTVLTDTPGRVSLPSRLTFGLSWEKMDPSSVVAKWMVGADFSFQDWTEFTNFDQPEELDRKLSASLGLQFIPDFTSVKKGFWRRSVYRAGFNYSQNPQVFEGQNINEISGSLGVSIPVGRSSTLLNISMEGGRRGTMNNNLVQERFLKFHLGITINDTWFVKRRFD